MGRKPKPTALKKLQGNPGKRALNKKEPQLDNTMPQCPPHLNDEAKKEWRRMAKRLHDAGILTYVDRASLAAYCQAYGRWVEAEELAEKDGLIIETSNGNKIQNPAVGIANKAMADMVKIASEFGMTPSSRTKLKTELDTKDETLAEQLFRMTSA